MTQADPTPARHRIFLVVALVLVSLVIVGMVALALPYLESRYRPLIVQYLASTLPADEKVKIYAQISKETHSLWDTVPEPLVGRIAKPNLDVMESYAEITTNNAGLRAKRAYLPKLPDTYRIICLGDSLVFGEAGKEEDRWCDQLQHWFNEKDVRIEGKPVETLAIGLPSWTMLQEASYLASRLSEYEPDLVIVMTVSNDITDDSGVTGAGLLTGDFSNSQRQWGSGVLQISAGAEYGQHDYTALMYDLAPIAQEYWATGMASLKRLSVLQKKRGGKILFSVLNDEGKRSSYFENMYALQFIRAGITDPLVIVSYQKSVKTMLPHDSHPNREGHALLAGQYLHAMKKLDWLDAGKKSLPGVGSSPYPQFKQQVDNADIERGRANFIKKIPGQINFTMMSLENAKALLGGVLPERSNPLSSPWASVRAGFLIKPSSKAASRFVLKIMIPERVELFPLQVTLHMQGKLEKHFTFEQGGEHKLMLDVPSSLTSLPAVEIMLESDHYFTQIEDHRMKVFQLVSAHWE